MKRILVFTIALLSLAGSALASWTDLPLRAGAKNVYVSSSQGDDANDGLTASTPKRTFYGTLSPTPTNPNNRIPGAFNIITSGAGDHLLLRRGDTFSELLQWNKSGFSAEYPAVMSSYGTGPRPIIDRGNDMGMIISSMSGPTVHDVAVMGIHYLAAQRDWSRPGFAVQPRGAVGLQVSAGGTPPPIIVDGLLIEDCRFEFVGQGIALVGPFFESIRNVTINRNVFVDIYAVLPSGHTNAVFASNTTGLKIKENLVDGVQRTAIAAGVPNVVESSLSHGFYIQSDSRDVVVRNNVVANAFDGGMMRPGGVYRNNVVIGPSIGSHHGYMFSDSAPIITAGVIPWVVGNVFVRPSQTGIQMGNVSFGLAENNMILSGSTTGAVGFNLIGQTFLSQVGTNNLTLRGNYILGMQALTSYGSSISNITVEGNQFRAPSRIINHIEYEAGDFHYASNSYFSSAAANQWFRVVNTNYDLSSWATFVGESAPLTASPVDPITAPDIATYHASIGGIGTEAAFLLVARQNSRDSFDDRYLAANIIQYLRQQFGLPPL